MEAVFIGIGIVGILGLLNLSSAYEAGHLGNEGEFCSCRLCTAIVSYMDVDSRSKFDAGFHTENLKKLRANKLSIHIS
jgi:hypothetical protein